MLNWFETRKTTINQFKPLNKTFCIIPHLFDLLIFFMKTDREKKGVVSLFLGSTNAIFLTHNPSLGPIEEEQKCRKMLFPFSKGYSLLQLNQILGQNWSKFTIMSQPNQVDLGYFLEWSKPFIFVELARSLSGWVGCCIILYFLHISSSWLKIRLHA